MCVCVRWLQWSCWWCELSSPGYWWWFFSDVQQGWHLLVSSLYGTHKNSKLNILYRSIQCFMHWNSRMGSPAHSAGDLSSPYTRVWRKAIHFFLLPKRFCESQSPSWLFPLARYWFNTMTTAKRRQAANRVQSQLNYVSWSRLLCWRKLRQLPQSPEQRAIYDWAWSGNS